MEYINFDDKLIHVTLEGRLLELTFKEALERGIVTQEYLDEQEKGFLLFTLIDLEDAGYIDITDEHNKQNNTNHLYVFRSPNNHMFYCDSMEEVFDLEEYGYIPEKNKLAC